MQEELTKLSKIISAIIDKTCIPTFCSECPLNNGNDVSCALAKIILAKNELYNKLNENEVK